MCLEVKSKCEPILRRFNFRWPNMLDCNNLPERSDVSNLCMDPPSLDDNVDRQMLGGDVSDFMPGGIRESEEWHKLLESLQGKSSTTLIPKSTLPPGGDCPDRYVYVENLRNNNTCAPRCNMDVYFRQEDKRFSEIWMIVWASLCFFSTMMTVVTFLVDTSRFGYPERPIIFLSMCYAIYSAAYIIRAIIGPDAINCDENRYEVR